MSEYTLTVFNNIVDVLQSLKSISLALIVFYPLVVAPINGIVYMENGPYLSIRDFFTIYLIIIAIYLLLKIFLPF